MTDHDPHAVEPDDEQRHLPSDDPLWNESHYLDVVSHDGRVAGYARIGLYPNLGVTWWTAMVVGPDRPVVASVAYDLPVPELGLGPARCRIRHGHRRGVAARPRPGPRDGARPGPRPAGRHLPGRPGHADRPRARPHVDDRRRALPVRRHHPLRDPLPGGRDHHRGGRGAGGRGPRPARPLLGRPGLVGLRVVLVRRSARRRHPGPRRRHPHPGSPPRPGLRAAPRGRPGDGHRSRRHRGHRRRRVPHRRTGPHRAGRDRPDHRPCRLRAARPDRHRRPGRRGSPARRCG